MTHPDDEISISAWIKRLTNAGAKVYLSWTHGTTVREAEGRNAAKVLGIPESNLRCFGGPDGTIHEHMESYINHYRDWIAQVKPDRIVCGAFEQGHLDHDATNYMLNRVFDGPILEVPFYHAYLSRVQRMGRFSTVCEQEILGLEPIEVRFKKDFAKLYPSTNIWSCLLWYEIAQVAQFKRPELALTERMRLQEHRNFHEPNHRGKLLERVRSCPRWSSWIRALNEFESAHGPYESQARDALRPVPYA
jgi:hypothetical protein